MRPRDRRMGFGSTLAFTCLALFLLLIGPGSASAAESEYKGWFLSLDAALTQPNSLDQHFATTDNTPAASTPGTGERLVLKTDSDFTWRASVGYGFGKGLGSLQVSYWSFDNENTTSGAASYYLFPTIFGYLYTGGQVLNNATFTAAGKVKARTEDLDYVRPIPVGEKFTVKWLAGLRVAHYEEDLSFNGSDAAYTYLQDKHFQSDALGLRVGVTGVFGFTKHFSLEAGMAASFMQADTKGDASQTFVSTGLTEAKSTKDDYIRGEIRDYDFRASWDYGRLIYYFGYTASEWDGLVSDPLPAGGGCFGGCSGYGPRGRDSIAFNSFHGGITIRYGKPR